MRIFYEKILLNMNIININNIKYINNIYCINRI